jgi:hypothetical protein
MSKKNEMILPADISFAIWVLASHAFYDDELPIEAGAIEDIAYYESHVLQCGIEVNLKALDIDINGWLNIFSNSKRVIAGDNPDLFFNLRLPSDLSAVIKTLQIMTGKDLWQILWHGTSHCFDDLVNKGKGEDFETNLALINVHLMDDGSPVDIDTITWDDIRE